MILNVSTNTLSHDGAHVQFASMQTRLIEALASGKAVTYERLISLMWEERDEPENAYNNVRVQIRIARNKLFAHNFPLAIRSIHSTGYVLSTPVKIVHDGAPPIVIPAALRADLEAALNASRNTKAAERVFAGMVG